MPEPDRVRAVAHFDIDAFYASVAIRDDPSLRGKPVAIAGSSRRAVVLTASYEARPFGVRSAMPLYRALEACPRLVVVKPDMQKYRVVSREVFAVFHNHSQMVEGLSLDEAFVDLGELTFDNAIERAKAVRNDVLRATGLTVSAGVATGKLVAKIASDRCKPDGLLAVAPGTETEFLAPLAVGKLWGIGPKTEARLNALGIATIADLAAANGLERVFGSSAGRMRDLANGIDERRVETGRETKSISTEETFEYDVRDEAELISLLRVQALELAHKLAEDDATARTVGIKIRRGDFSTIGRQTHLAEPTRSARRIFDAAVVCLKRAELRGAPVRLLGTRVASIENGSAAQISLFARGPL
jgi:DNA polymerase IV